MNEKPEMPEINKKTENNEKLDPMWNDIKKSNDYWHDLKDKQMVTAGMTALLLAVIFGFFFSRFLTTFPQLAFFLFSIIALSSSYICLKKLNWLINPRLFFWAIPIVVISSFNAIFQLAIFHYFNVVIIIILFAIIIIGATNKEKIQYESLTYWRKIGRVTLSHFSAGINLQKRLSTMTKLTKNSTLSRILLGIACALPVSGIILVLMLSGDQVFLALTTQFFQNIELNFFVFIWRLIVITFMTVYFSGFLYQAHAIKTSQVIVPPKNLDTIIAVSFLAVLNVLFAVFCYIQFAFLFTGGANTLPQGVTYSEYAREGFFQLLLITIINFGVIIIFMKYFQKMTPSIKFMLLLLSIFTGVLIASSFYRMNLYMDVFGFTPLRMMVVTFLAMESFFLIATIYALFKPRFNIFKFYLMVGLVFFIIANFTSTSFVSGRLNTIWHFNPHREYVFDEHSHFLGIDNVRDLILIHDHATDLSVQMNIAHHLHVLRNRHDNAPWQNWSLLQHIHMTHLHQFFARSRLR